MNVGEERDAGVMWDGCASGGLGPLTGGQVTPHGTE